MEVNSRQFRFLKEALNTWEQEKLISEEQAQVLQQSLRTRSFRWQTLARYALWAAASCVGLSLLAVVTDQELIKWLESLLVLSEAGRSLCLAILAAVLFAAGRWKAQKGTITQPLFYFLGAMSVAGSLTYLGMWLDTGSGHYSLLILMASVIYLIAALLLPSSLVWFLALSASALGIVTELEYRGGDDVFLGRELAVAMVVYSSLLLLLSHGLKVWERLQGILTVTRCFSVFLLFISLWMLTMMEGYEEHSVPATEHWLWVALLTLMSLLAIAGGLKWNDDLFRAAGISFFLINVYTRYFELGWESLHKALFFALLAISFWVLGRFAEKLWSGGSKAAGLKQPVQ